MQSFGHGAAVTKVLHVRENLLAVGGASGGITLWDSRHSAKPLRTVDVGTGYVPAILSMPTRHFDQLLLTYDQDRTQKHNVSNCECVSAVQSHHSNGSQFARRQPAGQHSRWHLPCQPR